MVRFRAFNDAGLDDAITIATIAAAAIIIDPSANRARRETDELPMGM
jgi:hypothetical protein